MARGDSLNALISDTTTFGNQQFASQAQQYNELNSLRERLADDYYNYVDELQQKHQKKELALTRKLFDARIEMQEEFLAKVAKAEQKDRKKAEAKYRKQLDDQLAAYKKFLREREKLEQSSWKREMALAAREGAGTLRSGLLNPSNWTKFKQDTAGLSKNIKFGAAVDGIIAGLADLSKKLDSQVDAIASYQSLINTRLQGSGRRWEGSWLTGRSGISQTITGLVGMSPYVKQEAVFQNLAKLVDRGIAYNVEQRAFLQTISDKIATTFDAANGTLLQLVRVQQADTTAARLGLEANLTRFLNGMFQSTEYLSEVSPGIKEALYEATANMGAESGVAFEYQVQKWLGSLYSVGMSRSGVQSIASALGMLGSGNISGLAGNPAMQNLLVMSASRAGKSYAELLTQGIDGSDVNSLMKSMVEYLAEIAEGSNNVVKSQYGAIFGMSMSDLKSVTNVLRSIGDISRTSLDYGGAMGELFSQAGQIAGRMSVGEMMQNVWSNMMYSMSAGIAANPALYGIWKAASLLEDTMGGIALPDIKVLGSGVNLQTTVADLMRVGALSGGILSSIGAMAAAGSGGGFNAAKMFEALGLSGSGISVVSRGAGLGGITGGQQVSQSALIAGNTSGEDVYGSTMAGAESEQSAKLAEAKKENPNAEFDERIGRNVESIYHLLASVIVEGIGIRTYSSYEESFPGQF